MGTKTKKAGTSAEKTSTKAETAQLSLKKQKMKANREKRRQTHVHLIDACVELFYFYVQYVYKNCIHTIQYVQNQHRAMATISVYIVILYSRKFSREKGFVKVLKLKILQKKITFCN